MTACAHGQLMFDAVENGKEITITRHGAPVARLVSVRAEVSGVNEQRGCD